MSFEIALTIFVVFGLLIALIKQSASAELLALGATSILLIFGIISTKDFLSVFSNAAAMTVATMFILSAALEETGVIDAIASKITDIANSNNQLAVLAIFATAFAASAFINNTSVVLILIPIVISLSKTTQMNSGKLLIPLSYFAIFGGGCTLIGTSTNLLVDGVAQNLGQKPFGMFEITIPALFIAISGAAYLYFFGKNLLPNSANIAQNLDEKSENKFISHFRVNEDSNLIGQNLSDLQALQIENLEILEFIQAPINETAFGKILNNMSKFVRRINFIENTTKDTATPLIKAGDDLIISATRAALHEFSKKYDGSGKEKSVVEVLMGMNSPIINRTIYEFNRDNFYNIEVIAIQRSDLVDVANFTSMILKIGDTLMIRGSKEAIARALRIGLFNSIEKPIANIKSKPKAIIAIITICSVVLAAAFKIIPIAGAGILGVAFLLLTRTIELRNAYKSLKPDVIFLIYFMLAISIAMQNSGALALILDALSGYLSHASPFITISILFLLTSIITEVFSNNAAAIMLTPIAIGLANNMGVDARPFAAAIMLGASASFATPIGYQTNMLVYNAGGYKFTDFLKIGVPINIIAWIVASLVIPIYWKI